MTDTTPAAASQPVFQVQRIYLKDASLEMPNAPTVFLESENPKVDVQLEVSDAPVLDGLHEVVVRVTVTAKVKEKVLFLVEGKQAGIFEIRNVPAEQKPGIIGILCPGIVYPYLRANIADLITRTGLPPINLAEINFEAFYQQRMAAIAQQRAQPPTAPATGGGNGAASA
ncbi:MAG TPA: protein-export chaperone SecB [Burkholderiaceae bacterium]|nr:protein-export chaperone SecB [Burkholderiaceae bacterium]